MISAVYKTRWIGTGKSEADAWRPAIAHDYSIGSWTDLESGSPSLGGTTTIRCPSVPDDIHAAILADPGYGPGSVLAAVTVALDNMR